MTSIETVKKMYELFGLNDYAAIRELFAGNIRWNQMTGFPGGGKYTGADNVFEKVFESFNTQWLDWSTTITRYIDTSDGVIVIGYYEGIYKATKRYMKADFACEYKVCDGKILEFNQYTDTLLIGRAMNFN